MYLVFPVIIIVIVIVILAMFTFYFCPKLQVKHCREHYDYDYDRKNYIQSRSFGPMFKKIIAKGFSRVEYALWFDCNRFPYKKASTN